MRHIFLIIFLLGCVNSDAQLQTISGRVIEQDTKEPILYGTVAIYKNGVLITGTDTDYDGNYFLADLEPGAYMLEVRYLGYKDKELSIVLKDEKDFVLNIELNEARVFTCGFSCGFPSLRLFNQYDTSSGQTFAPINGFLRPNLVH